MSGPSWLDDVDHHKRTTVHLEPRKELRIAVGTRIAERPRTERLLGSADFTA